jgi:peptidoglycan biosynthesis protein MviN/MurJ (putative lipid II flippase)
MLPLGFSLATIINAIALWIAFGREFRGFSKSVLRVLYQSFASSVIMGFVAYVTLDKLGRYFDLSTFYGVFSQGFVAGMAGIMMLLLTLKALRSRELSEMWKTLHRKIWKADVILPEQEGM